MIYIPPHIYTTRIRAGGRIVSVRLSDGRPPSVDRSISHRRLAPRRPASLLALVVLALLALALLALALLAKGSVSKDICHIISLISYYIIHIIEARDAPGG
jgi:hypothetical protein